MRFIERLTKVHGVFPRNEVTGVLFRDSLTHADFFTKKIFYIFLF
nr:MAG TPA: hypothetical protein [Caudoviricetes sp.]